MTMKKNLLPLLLLFSLSAFGQWSGAVIDTLTQNTERDEILNQSFVSDQGNTLHLISERALTAGGWMILYFKHPSNSPWTIEDTVSIGPSYAPTLAVSGQDGIPYISCTENDTVDGEIVIYTKTGSVWTREQITSNQEEDSSPSITIDQDGFIHVAWIWENGSGNYKINYATNRSGIWSIQTIVNSQLGPFGSGASPQLALDPTGIAHIVYRGGNFGTYRIHHAYNDSIGGAIWNFDFLSTPNAEDLSSSLVVSEDTIVHALVSGNDGFGFPTHAYYLSKSPGAISFSSAADVANGFSAEVGSLSISNNSASCVLNEVSGNIFTGNVIYSEANSGWNAITLLNTQEIYNAQMLIDQNGKGYVAAYQGNTFQTEETIVYGPDFSTGIKNTESGIELFSCFQNNENITLNFRKSFQGIINVRDINGKITQTIELNTNAGESKTISMLNSASGMYLFEVLNPRERFARKILYTN